MVNLIARVMPFLWAGFAFAEDIKDAPIPTEMNWVGITIFALIFFGGTAGFIFAVWWKARGKKGDENAPGT